MAVGAEHDHEDDADEQTKKLVGKRKRSSVLASRKRANMVVYAESRLGRTRSYWRAGGVHGRTGAPAAGPHTPHPPYALHLPPPTLHPPYALHLPPHLVDAMVQTAAPAR